MVNFAPADVTLVTSHHHAFNAWPLDVSNSQARIIIACQLGVLETANMWSTHAHNRPKTRRYDVVENSNSVAQNLLTNRGNVTFTALYYCTSKFTLFVIIISITTSSLHYNQLSHLHHYHHRRCNHQHLFRSYHHFRHHNHSLSSPSHYHRRRHRH